MKSDALLQVIFDQSWSVAGSNDVLNLRHELALIAIEHLAAAQGRGHWYVCLSAFDTPSELDLPITQLNRAGLNRIRGILLRETPGGSSILGPSVDRAERAASQFPGSHRLLICASDYEIYDSDPGGALQRLVSSSATEVLALSLRNEPPLLLAQSNVRCAQVLATDDPVNLANHVIDAALSCATDHEEIRNAS